MQFSDKQFLAQAIRHWDNDFNDIEAAARTRQNISLSSGLAGLLLIEYGLYRYTKEGLHSDRLSSLQQAIAELLESSQQKAGLWTGILGPLYAVEYIRRGHPELLSPEITQFVDDMDDTLIEAARGDQSRLHYDLISGLCGFGAYALMRSDHVASSKLYAVVEQALIARAEHHEEGWTWRTAPRFAGVGLKSEDGHIDFGIAHGVAGVIGLMGAAISSDIATGDTHSALRHALKHLRSQTFANSAYYTFKTDSLSSYKKVRLAWCYGDLGVACALLLAYTALDDIEGQSYAVEVLRKRFSGPEEDFLLSDSALCHGRAGVWRMTQRLCRRVHIDEAAQVGANNLAAILTDDLKFQVFEQRPFLLDGYGGILMSLATAEVEEKTPWDVCMNFGF